MNPIACEALERARRAISGATAAVQTRNHWSPDEEQRLITLYSDTPMPELMSIFARPDRAIYAKAMALGLKRSEAYLASEHACRLRRGGDVGAEHRFQADHTPWNKGVSFKAGGRSAETRFPPGSIPHNTVPVGTERVTDDGIRQRKVRDDGPAHRRWKSVHSILWEEAHGEIPPGHLVVFRDRNTEHLELENLELITRGENMRRNTIHRYPEELKSTIRLLGKLKRTINEASREKQDD